MTPSVMPLRRSVALILATCVFLAALQSSALAQGSLGDIFGQLLKQGIEQSADAVSRQLADEQTKRQLQRNLASLGYYNGAADGDFGPQSQAALARFVAAYGLAPDLTLVDYARLSDEALNGTAASNEPSNGGSTTSADNGAQRTIDEIIVRTMPLGAGYPSGKPIDIRGFHTGMSADEAVPLADDYYGAANQRPAKMVGQFPYSEISDTTYVGPQSAIDANAPYDVITLVMSSFPSGGQTYAIGRDVLYSFDDAPNTDTYVQSLVEKYGQPTGKSRIDNSYGKGIRLIYKYLDGVQQTNVDGCYFHDDLVHTLLDRFIAVYPRSEFSQTYAGDSNNWAELLAEMYRGSHRGTVCSVHMEIELYYSLADPNVSSSSMNGLMVDAKRIMSARTTLIDLDRFVFTNNVDFDAIQELQKRASHKNAQTKPSL